MKRVDLMSIPALISAMRKSFREYAKYFAIPVIAAVITVGCGKTILTNDENGGEPQTIEVDESEDVTFCSCFDVENMDKTIPFINGFLASLPNSLNDEQKLQALTTWLNSCSCITDATIVCASCIKTLPLQSEIAISFEENGITKSFILDISMSNPLKAIHYHEGIAPNMNKVLMLKVDYTTNTFLGGKELVFFANSDSFSITNEYQPPGDFGYLKLYYEEINELLFMAPFIGWAAVK